MTAATLADLQAAEATLEQARAQRAAYAGLHPQRLDTKVRLAQENLQALTLALKAAGRLPRTPHEDLETRLDAAFPKARPKEIVTFENARYRRRVDPATRDAAGRVSTWDRGWTPLSDPLPADRPIPD